MTMKNRGFTLIETLIAITVLSFAIVGPFQIAEGVLSSAYVARDKLSASALAEEGLEYVRSVRDSNVVYNTHHAGSRTQFAGFDGTSGSPNCYTNSCVVDPGQQSATVCSDASCSTQPLYYASNGLFTQVTTGNTKTKFTRKVQFAALNATSTQVIVTVSWTGHSAYSVVLTEIFTNWI